MTGSTRCSCSQDFTITFVICQTISIEKLCLSKLNKMFKVIRKQFLPLFGPETRGDPKSRNGRVAEWRKMTPNPKTRNACQGMLRKFCTKTLSAWLIYPHDDNARD